MSKKINFRFLTKSIYAFILAAVFVMALLIIFSTLKIPGNYKLFVVQSGSMEPGIKKMAIVVVKPAKNYQKGDIITIFEPANPKVTLTHRIYEIEEKDGHKYFITKGDANEDPDTEKRMENSILGKVIINIPFLGYLVSFAKTKQGLLFLVIIPAVIIVYNELLGIKTELKKLILARKEAKK